MGYKLKKPEAEYFINTINWGHFGFDCSCKENKGISIINSGKGFKVLYENYGINFGKGHDFYFRLSSFKRAIEAAEETEQELLILECKNCKNRFMFNQKIFSDLEKEIKRSSD